MNISLSSTILNKPEPYAPDRSKSQSSNSSRNKQNPCMNRLKG
ncbi:BgTH12-04205 [Blumeria graminis f. sp. triticale]|uniref:BgTH12-04202 n=1 Tax=Blumeria graminis f. sp. triticale TaxID=1689686 RepID=A0A9W4DE26_BLUGR|nr:BgTH12-04202 [Blumeria graminis f. sp. triticale]CAD6500102.1 BgTH12-04205 [Blumeria graminis f. sp. triticale]